MSDKIFVNPYEIRSLSFKLAKQIYDSGIRPEKILTYGSNDGIVGYYIMEYFNFRGWRIGSHFDGCGVDVTGIVLYEGSKEHTASIFANPTNLPEYYIKETLCNVIFPHELCTLSREEIYEQMGPHIYNMLYDLPETTS